MRPVEDVAQVLELGATALTASEISCRTGVPRCTVRDWLAGRFPRRMCAGDLLLPSCSACGAPDHGFSQLPPVYVYLLGLYLGDGCLSAHRGGVYKLRIVLDLVYPGIVAECEAAIRQIAPNNKVRRLERRGNIGARADVSNVEVYSYSKGWPCFFPQHGPGRKHHRPVELVQWQDKLADRHPELLLRGLIHSDGCRFMNTGTGWRNPRYSFTNLSVGIRKIFCASCDLLELRWTTAGHTIYVSRKADVARMDEFIGPKA